MKEKIFLAALLIFISLLSSCGFISSTVVIRPGAKNVRTAAIPYNYAEDYEFRSGRSLAIQGKYFFLVTKENSHYYILRCFDDTLGLLWENHLVTGESESEPDYFFDGSSIRSYSISGESEKQVLYTRKIDLRNGQILAFSPVIRQDKNQTDFEITFSHDSSKILVTNYEKRDSAIIGHYRIFTPRFEPISETSYAIELHGDNFPFLSDASVKAEKISSLSISGLGPALEKYLIARVSDDGEPFLYTVRKNSYEFEFIITRIVPQKQLISHFPLNDRLQEAKNFTYFTGTRSDSGNIFTNGIFVFEDSVRVLSSRFSLYENETKYSQYFSFPLNKTEIERKNRIEIYFPVRPVYASQALQILTFEPFIYQGYNMLLERYSGSYGPATFIALDADGKLLWTKTLEKASQLTARDRGGLIYAEGPAHMKQFGGTLKIFHRDRSKESDGFFCHELDLATGRLKNLTVPFTLGNFPKGGVLWLRHLTQWLNEKTAIVAFQEGHFSGNMKLIRFSAEQ